MLFLAVNIYENQGNATKTLFFAFLVFKFNVFRYILKLQGEIEKPRPGYIYIGITSANTNPSR